MMSSSGRDLTLEMGISRAHKHIQPKITWPTWLRMRPQGMGKTIGPPLYGCDLVFPALASCAMKLATSVRLTPLGMVCDTTSYGGL